MNAGRQAGRAPGRSQAGPHPLGGSPDVLVGRGANISRGFTLIEVLVALAIVAITLGAGIRAATTLTDNAARLADVSAAQWCADNQLTALKLGKILPGIGDSDFTCDQLGRSYRGKLVVRPTPNPNFRRIDAQVFDETDRPLVRLSTVRSRF